MRLSRSIVHAPLRTRHYRHRADSLPLAAVNRRTVAGFQHAGSAAVFAAYTLPASRSSRFFLTLDS
jgi:hypothetical protein